jgi:hypothetical protein
VAFGLKADEGISPDNRLGEDIRERNSTLAKTITCQESAFAREFE